MDIYRTIGEAWLNVCQRCLRQGRTYTITRGSYTGQQRKQLLAFMISHPGTRPLGLEYKGMPISDDESIGRYFEDYLIDTRLTANEQYTYANRFAPYLETVGEMLRQAPGTNQATIEVGRPEDLGLTDPPC